MPDKISSHNCLMLSRFHQMVKYGWQRNHILQDLTGLEIQNSMKTSKTKNRFEPVIKNRNPVSSKTGINIPTHNADVCKRH